MVQTQEELDGWTYIVVPGWPTGGFKNEGRLERAGNVLLPQSFTLRATNEEKGESVFLCFVTHEGEVKMSAVLSSHSDAPTGIDLLRAAMPIESWKRLAVVQMTTWLATTDPDALPRKPLHHAASEALGDDWVQLLRAWRDVSPDEATPREAIKAALATPVERVKRRRNRITREHLEAVAEIYRTANAAGAAPTRAVQDAFLTTHSTAAKWVSQARKEGILGAAPGSRGGEVGNSAAAAAARPAAEAAIQPVASKVSKVAADALKRSETGECEE